MKKVFLFVFILLTTALLAQQTPQPPSTPASDDISGMYTFLREGEFVQITVEDGGNVSGFVSRYGDLDSDRGAFLDQFFKKGSLNGTKLEFTTQQVHGTWYEFSGTVRRGEGKTPNEDAYYVIEGKLTRYMMGNDKKATAQSREITMKSFPQDATVAHPNKD